jgi:hypothetical protein
MLMPCNPAHAWWSDPKITHHMLTVRSTNMLNQVNLFHAAELIKGSKAPDLIDAKHKGTLQQRHYALVRKNFDAALASSEKGESKQTAYRIAIAFHYLQDAVDISTLFKDKYKEGIRRICHDTLENWQEVMKIPDMGKVYRDTYRSELQILKRLDLKQAVQRLHNRKHDLAGSMQSIISEIEQRNNAGGVSDMEVKGLTKILLQCIATVQAAQDIMLEQFAYRYEGQ